MLRRRRPAKVSYRSARPDKILQTGDNSHEAEYEYGNGDDDDDGHGDHDKRVRLQSAIVAPALNGLESAGRIAMPGVDPKRRR